jgi:DNA-directed RNA polymerase subunit A'
MIDRLEIEQGQQFVRDFIFKITKLALAYLMDVGFSISISDQDIPADARAEIKAVIDKVERDIDGLIQSFERGEGKILAGRTPKESLETWIKRRVSKVLDEVEGILQGRMAENFTMSMAKSGARGSMINLVQTSAVVGQEMIMGERMERGYYERTFPHFKRGDLSLESKGFVGHGFKDGLSPFEFFFDAVNSRESLMDKSLKTRHSGYMERRLVGALQDLKIEYDGTVRDSSKRVVQFTPGEDGLDPSKVERGGINVERTSRRL